MNETPTPAASAAQPPSHARVRARKRAVFLEADAWAVLDQAAVSHVGFIDNARPMVIPMIHARIGDTLYLHGAKATRIVKRLGASVPVCLTATVLDGLVLARSAFHHSMNYRCVVVHGMARAVADAREKHDALVALTDHLLPGRWDEVREMSDKEEHATGVIALDVEHMTMKRREGPPVDDADDYALPIWAGVVDIAERVGAVHPDAALDACVPRPASLDAFMDARGEPAKVRGDET
ncbi:pyridoxamine 5'-phosphate oxidase family protein [Stappia sp. ES.058]|uniref:pyridoxamine 5'-phosphate oxidase family protein n=1 Tax=Stappia sp. ES.058 TaxID=1881061 RepID=UPI000B814237|nr:pyridoxamine 5'-phosphate oxidase family protein [Stappia sp. ES.058]